MFSSTTRTFHNLDSLRAFAVIAVLVHHLTALLMSRQVLPPIHGFAEAGHVGVLAFFVHTSLVLMFSLDRIAAEGRERSFYIRRISRIYPLSILCVATVLVFRIPSSPEMSFVRTSTINIFANFLLIQNIIGRISVSNPLWSLPFEVQMYAVLPFLHKLTARRHSISLLVALILGFSLIGWTVQHQTGHASMLAFVPCFLGGILAYELRKTIPFLPSLVWPFFLIFWITAVSLGLRYATSDIYQPVTWVAAVVLGSTIFCFRDSTHTYWNKVMEVIAKYSYGIYLTHLPIMWLAFYKMQIHSTWASIVVWLFGTAALSVATFHLIESPMIKLGRQFSDYLAPHPQPIEVEIMPAAVGAAAGAADGSFLVSDTKS